MKFLPASWADVFLPDYPVWEIVARGFVLFFTILFILRLLPRRTTGELGPMDLVFILIITEAASHSLGDFNTVGDGIIMIFTFIFCDYLVNRLTFSFPALQKIFSNSEIIVVKDGQLLKRNMRKELLTKDELMATLREQGIEDLKKVKKAFVEGEGNITVIKYED